MAGPAGAVHVAEDVVLDERELLGNEVHMVCCAYQRRPGQLLTVCGQEITGGVVTAEDLGVSCAPCIETETTQQRCRTTPYCYEWLRDQPESR